MEGRNRCDVIRWHREDAHQEGGLMDVLQSPSVIDEISSTNSTCSHLTWEQAVAKKVLFNKMQIRRQRTIRHTTSSLTFIIPLLRFTTLRWCRSRMYQIADFFLSLLILRDCCFSRVLLIMICEHTSNNIKTNINISSSFPLLPSSLLISSHVYKFSCLSFSNFLCCAQYTHENESNTNRIIKITYVQLNSHILLAVKWNWNWEKLKKVKWCCWWWWFCGGDMDKVN